MIKQESLNHSPLLLLDKFSPWLRIKLRPAIMKQKVLVSRDRKREADESLRLQQIESI